MESVIYFKEADMLDIKIKDMLSVESEEVAPGVIVDYAADGSVVAIQIEEAVKKMGIKIERIK